MIKPFKAKLYQGQKNFYVNPDYADIFKFLGVNSKNDVFFKSNPFYGLHFQTNEDEPPFHYFENTFESNRTGFFRVKENELPLLHGDKVYPEQVEKYFENLAVSIEYILDTVSNSNKWAKTNYPGAYFPGLENAIVQYKKELKDKE